MNLRRLCGGAAFAAVVATSAAAAPSTGKGSLGWGQQKGALPAKDIIEAIIVDDPSGYVIEHLGGGAYVVRVPGGSYELLVEIGEDFRIDGQEVFIDPDGDGIFEINGSIQGRMPAYAMVSFAIDGDMSGTSPEAAVTVPPLGAVGVLGPGNSTGHKDSSAPDEDPDCANAGNGSGHAYGRCKDKGAPASPSGMASSGNSGNNGIGNGNVPPGHAEEIRKHVKRWW